MAVIYLIVSIICCGLYSVFADIFATRNKDGKNTALLFNLIICSTALVCWLIYFIFNPGFDAKIIPYALGLGASFFGAFFFSQLAYSRGNAPVITLIVSFSLILVAIYGFFFWNAEFTIFKIIGLILVVISLFLIIYKKSDGKKSSYLWLVFALIAMVANASCSIVEKNQQIVFLEQYGAPFLVLSTLFASLLSGCFLLIKRKEVRCENLKKNFIFPILAGIANFGLNLFVILLAGTSMSPTIIYPTISLSIILVLLYSLFIKKEKLSLMQWVGIAIGVAAVAVLSI